uniref:Uncharacterized protein n=1 Tax=Oryza barthii TaxID=65489 RepID=A0A0D3HUC9_9ORYZ
MAAASKGGSPGNGGGGGAMSAPPPWPAMVGELLTIGEQTVGLLRIAESQLLCQYIVLEPPAMTMVALANDDDKASAAASSHLTDVQPETQIYVLHTAGCISWKDVGVIAFFGGI